MLPAHWLQLRRSTPRLRKKAGHCVWGEEIPPVSAGKKINCVFGPQTSAVFIQRR